MNQKAAHLVSTKWHITIISPYLHGNKRQGGERQRSLCKTRAKPSWCLLHNCSHMQCLMHTRTTVHCKHNCWQTGSLQDLHACPEALNSKPSPQKNRDWKTEESSMPASYWPTAVGPVWAWRVCISTDIQGFLILHSSFSEEKYKDYSWNCKI